MKKVVTTVVKQIRNFSGRGLTYRVGPGAIARAATVCWIKAAPRAIPPRVVIHRFVRLNHANGLATPLTILSSRLSHVLVLGS